MSKMATTRVNNLAHLNAYKIGALASEDIVLDAIYLLDKNVDTTDIIQIIAQRFGIKMPMGTIVPIIEKLLVDRKIQMVDINRYNLSSYIKAELVKKRAEDSEIKRKALESWLNRLGIDHDSNEELYRIMNEAIDLFLDKIFVIHGAASYKLIGATIAYETFDINAIAQEVSVKYLKHQDFINTKLPTIFTFYEDIKIITFLKLKINKAIAYLSSVMPSNIHTHICDKLGCTVIYLDTNVLYRLLNLQGERRYLSVKDTIKLCQEKGTIFKVSSETYGELTKRIKYDSKVLVEHPIKTNLATYGYKYRTTDNYVSTYWEKAAKTGISVEDYNAYFRNIDIVLSEEYNIEIERMTINEDTFVSTVQDFYSKITLVDNDKSPTVAWHDAYCLAYVKKQQLQHAKNAIDSKCLFLTTDISLINLQETDFELKENVPIALTPSQLLQVFSFLTNTGDYTETFASLFASVSIGLSNINYSNEDIQEILSRISHYSLHSPSIAEKVLENQLLSQKYRQLDNDAEKEEIIYNEISSALLESLEQAESEKNALKCTNETLEVSLKNNEATFSILHVELKEKDTIIKKQDVIITNQCNKYVHRKWRHWVIWHRISIGFGCIMFISYPVALVLIIRKYGFDWDVVRVILPLLYSVLNTGLAIKLLKYGVKIYTPNIRSNIEEQYRNEYLSNYKNTIDGNMS